MPSIAREVTIVQFIAYAACVLTGFLAGLLAFKTKDRWCPACGNTTVRIRREHEGREAQH
jgi:hypothetical protein